MKKVLIIGAGIGGMSSAALFAKDGYDVTVVEKNNTFGGRGITYSNKEFMFDMGPSWYLMPEVFERFFGKFGKKSSDFFKLIKLEPYYRVFFEDDGKIDVPSNLKEIYSLFDTFEENGGEKLKKYLEKAKYKYDIAMDKFLYKEYNSIIDFFNPQILIEGTKLHLFSSIDSYAKKYFSSEKARKILEYSMVFLGGSPSNTPALYSIMSHVDLNLGVWYPYGGIWKLMEAIYLLGKENGVKYIFDNEVTEIIVSNGKATGVKTKNGKISADIVIADADYPHVEMDLLDEKNRTYNEKYWEKKVIAPSSLLIYLGLKGRINGLKHHNLFLAKNWNEHFDSIFKNHNSWPDNPSYYVGCPSKTDDTVAPNGCENIFVLVPVAAGLKDDDKIREEYFNKTISHMEKTLGENIFDKIIEKRIFSHRDFSLYYNAYKGTALGMAHTLFQTAVFRPKHKSKKVSNLYYVGHFTHPGVGMPMAMISAEIVHGEILKNDR